MGVRAGVDSTGIFCGLEAFYAFRGVEHIDKDWKTNPIGDEMIVGDDFHAAIQDWTESKDFYDTVKPATTSMISTTTLPWGYDRSGEMKYLVIHANVTGTAFEFSAHSL